MYRWSIRHFGDYHEIESPTQKTLELGCFAAKGHSPWRYFAVFYRGNLPPADEILANLKRKVQVGVTHPNGQTYSWEVIEKEVRQATQVLTRKPNEEE